MNPEAPTDPWTKGAHTGMSHMYLGQRGATKLAAKAGVKVPANYAPRAAAEGDSRCARGSRCQLGGYL